MFACNICGCTLGGYSFDQDGFTEGKWVNKVRALFIEERNWFSPSLSGVGHMDDPFDTVRAPRSSDDNYYDEDFIESKNVQFDSIEPSILADGSLHPATYTTGFFFHDSCYKLLQYACHLTPINIQTLNLYLRSFGVLASHGLVNWGHTYGGLFLSPDPHVRSIHPRLESCHPPGTSIYHKDPLLDDSFVRTLLQFHTLSHFDTVQLFPKVTSTRHASNECFETLPVELLELVLSYLPSRDVLHARIASRVLADIPLGQAFWRSRFSPGNEGDFLVEPLLFKKRLLTNSLFSDARVVYKATKSENCSLALANRRRVWGLVKPLSDALQSFALHQEFVGSVEPAGKQFATPWQPELDTEDTCRWDCAHGELLDGFTLPFHFGCRPLFKRSVSLLPQITVVKVSVLPFYDTTYVTGLRFCFVDGTESSIGYVLCDREVTLDTEGGLYGFRVAVGERGIHALSANGSHLVGDQASELKYKVVRLGQGSEVRMVKAYFDGMKMVHLAVPAYIHNPQGPYSMWTKAQGYAELLKVQAGS
ncbi:uncharacterized protein BDR25DRAFT_338615 [Lindgomyces ingoldianus]|uniref:Uncharacterized protein n=1 Tax=Lindgomyces ingoldianus TaxID=673940 RepID=A0ACB6RFC3_9PLEO|nr:uncharacterized protein BDR25DRAFT_338615 [Lindgomyces ingoldianus]KAF2477901.1 hypothetical protein BDR25DRAFT_338615 [Lindgomyces ingoldianus]